MAKLQARRNKKVADEKARLDKEAVLNAEEERRREMMEGLYREAEEKKEGPHPGKPTAGRPASRGVTPPLVSSVHSSYMPVSII